MKCLAIISMLLLGVLIAGCGSSGDGTGETDTFTMKGALSTANKASLKEIESLPGLDRIAMSLTCPTCAGSPTSFEMKLYQAWISANTDCSSPVLIEDHGAGGAVVELSSSPILFSGTPADGIYQCLILVASDNLIFTVNSDAVTAHAGCIDTTTINTQDIYRNGESDDGFWIDLAGDPIDATGSLAAPGDDRVTYFISTNITVAGAASTLAHMNQVLLLTTPMVVPGTVTLQQNWVDGIDNLFDFDSSTNFCALEEGSMGFL